MLGFGRRDDGGDGRSVAGVEARVEGVAGVDGRLEGVEGRGDVQSRCTWLGVSVWVELWVLMADVKAKVVKG